MNIITLQELQDSGVSLIDLQKSLTLTFKAKKYTRKLDIPKKFKEKALQICRQMQELSNETSVFITETNYSYTIWEEENDSKSDMIQEISKLSQSQNNSSIKTENKNANTSHYSLADHLNNLQQEFKLKASQVQMKTHIRQVDNSVVKNNHSVVKTTKNYPNKQVRKYRGALIEEPNLSVNSQAMNTEKKEVRKYRGAIIN